VAFYTGVPSSGGVWTSPNSHSMGEGGMYNKWPSGDEYTWETFVTCRYLPCCGGSALVPALVPCPFTIGCRWTWQESPRMSFMVLCMVFGRWLFYKWAETFSFINFSWIHEDCCDWRHPPCLCTNNQAKYAPRIFPWKGGGGAYPEAIYNLCFILKIML
jgi:hypothetical protein